MASLTETLALIEQLVADLESLAFGDDATSVTHSGQTRDSVAKAIKGKFDAIQAMVQGRLTYETKTLMDAAGAPPAGELAEVWNDLKLENNGLYGWDGTDWVKSTYDPLKEYQELKRRAQGLEFKAVSSFDKYTSSASDDITPVLVTEVGANKLSVLGHNDAGELEFTATPETAHRLVRSGISAAGAIPVNYCSALDDISMAYCTDDTEPKIIAAIMKDGSILQGDSSYDGLRIANYPVVYHIVNDGQSQSLGTTASPILTSPGDIHGYIMANGNLISKTDFYPLKSGGENNVETPASGIIEGLINWLIEKKNINISGKKFKFAASCPGVGGSTIDRYVPGGWYYDGFFDQVYGIKSAAEQMGYQYQIHAFTWSLGGTDMNSGTLYQDYYDNLLLLRSDREAQLRTTFGNPLLKLHCITWQNGQRVASGVLRTMDVPNAQWYASKNVPEIYCACPYYHFQFNDSVHLTNLSSKALGYYFQRVYREVVLLGNDWKPVQPESITAVGSTVYVSFHVPTGALKFDRDLIINTPANEGFRVLDDTGELTITAVRIIGGKKVEIDVLETIGANPRLSYAEVFDGSGVTTDNNHPRGTLRDSAGDIEQLTEYEIDDNGGPTVFPLHNFCVTFNETIN
jgi:hypothetical protein